MWIVCQADDSHVMSSYFLWTIIKNYIKILSAAVVIDTLRVNESEEICLFVWASEVWAAI